MSIMDTLGAISGRLDEYSPRPAFMVRVGDKQVTELNDRLMSLSLTDNRGFEAD